MIMMMVSHDDHVEDHDADHDHHNELLFHNFASPSQLLEEQTSHMHALVEDIKVTRDLSKVELIMEIWCSILTICLLFSFFYLKWTEGHHRGNSFCIFRWFPGFGETQGSRLLFSGGIMVILSYHDHIMIISWPYCDHILILWSYHDHIMIISSYYNYYNCHLKHHHCNEEKEIVELSDYKTKQNKTDPRIIWTKTPYILYSIYRESSEYLTI